jgi:hypothetical protein
MVQAEIEKIGERFGLILPKEVLDACGFGTEANVRVEEKALIVTANPLPGHGGWEEAIRTIPQELIDRDFDGLRDFRETRNEWDEHGWQSPDAGSDEKI